MCPPNKIVRDATLLIIEAMKKDNYETIKEIIKDFSAKGYITFFKSISPEDFSNVKLLNSIVEEAVASSNKKFYLGVVVFVPNISLKGVNEDCLKKYRSSVTCKADAHLRNKTMELNNRYLNESIFLKHFGIEDQNMYYLCMYDQRALNAI